MFATDRDLLVLEPGLVGQVGWVGQRLVSGVGSVGGTALEMSSQDNGFIEQGVGAGHVIAIGGNGYEIVSVGDEDECVVSRVRGSVDDDLIALASMVDVEISVPTFGPQIADVHRRVLRMIGLEPAGEAGEGELDETALVNAGDFIRLEALGALHLVWAGASAGLGGDSPAALRAEAYRARFAAERGRVVARIDTDGDGVADAARRPGLTRLVRS